MFRHFRERTESKTRMIVPSDCGATAYTGRRGTFGDYYAPECISRRVAEREIAREVVPECRTHNATTSIRLESSER